MNLKRAILCLVIMNATIASYQYIAQVRFISHTHQIETTCLIFSQCNFQLAIEFDIWRVPFESSSSCDAKAITEPKWLLNKQNLMKEHLLTAAPIKYVTTGIPTLINKFQVKTMLESWSSLTQRILEEKGNIVLGELKSENSSENLLLKLDKNDFINEAEDSQMHVLIEPLEKGINRTSRTVYYSFCSESNLMPVVYKLDQRSWKHYTYEPSFSLFSSASYSEYEGDTYVILFQKASVNIFSEFSVNKMTKGDKSEVLLERNWPLQRSVKGQVLNFNNPISLSLGSDFEFKSIKDHLCIDLNELIANSQILPPVIPIPSPCASSYYPVKINQNSFLTNGSVEFDFDVVPKKIAEIKDLVNHLRESADTSEADHKTILGNQSFVIHKPQFVVSQFDEEFDWYPEVKDSHLVLKMSSPQVVFVENEVCVAPYNSEIIYQSLNKDVKFDDLLSSFKKFISLIPEYEAFAHDYFNPDSEHNTLDGKSSFRQMTKSLASYFNSVYLNDFTIHQSENFVPFLDGIKEWPAVMNDKQDDTKIDKLSKSECGLILSDLNALLSQKTETSPTFSNLANLTNLLFYETLQKENIDMNILLEPKGTQILKKFLEFKKKALSVPLSNSKHWGDFTLKEEFSIEDIQNSAASVTNVELVFDKFLIKMLTSEALMKHAIPILEANSYKKFSEWCQSSPNKATVKWDQNIPNTDNYEGRTGVDQLKNQDYNSVYDKLKTSFANARKLYKFLTVPVDEIDCIAKNLPELFCTNMKKLLDYAKVQTYLNTLKSKVTENLVKTLELTCRLFNVDCPQTLKSFRETLLKGKITDIESYFQKINFLISANASAPLSNPKTIISQIDQIKKTLIAEESQSTSNLQTLINLLNTSIKIVLTLKQSKTSEAVREGKSIVFDLMNSEEWPLNNNNISNIVSAAPNADVNLVFTNNNKNIVSKFYLIQKASNGLKLAPFSPNKMIFEKEECVKIGYFSNSSENIRLGLMSNIAPPTYGFVGSFIFKAKIII